jgi:hypothetical protein
MGQEQMLHLLEQEQTQLLEQHQTGQNQSAQSDLVFLCEYTQVWQ